MYPRCDNMNTVCVKVIPWCVILKSGCDVICIAYAVIHIEAVMTYIHFFSKNWYIVCNVKNRLSVMSSNST